MPSAWILGQELIAKELDVWSTFRSAQLVIGMDHKGMHRTQAFETCCTICEEFKATMDIIHRNEVDDKHGAK